MICSANEVMTLATKAARGGGAPPAQATQFGQAALAHLIAKRDIVLLSNALKELPSGPILTHPLLFQKFFETTKDGLMETELPHSDLLLSYLDALPYDATALTKEGRLQIRLQRTIRSSGLPVSRVNLPKMLVDQMQTLAAKTLVPETATSRRSGAGAGLTDND